MRRQRRHNRGAIRCRLGRHDPERAVGADGVIRRCVRCAIYPRAQRADERFRLRDPAGVGRERGVCNEGRRAGGCDEGGYDGVDVSCYAGAYERDGETGLDGGREVGGCDLRDCGVELARGGERRGVVLG